MDERIICLAVGIYLGVLMIPYFIQKAKKKIFEEREKKKAFYI